MLKEIFLKYIAEKLAAFETKKTKKSSESAIRGVAQWIAVL
jgi:hypothetical protein